MPAPALGVCCWLKEDAQSCKAAPVHTWLVQWCPCPAHAATFLSPCQKTRPLCSAPSCGNRGTWASFPHRGSFHWGTCRALRSGRTQVFVPVTRRGGKKKHRAVATRKTIPCWPQQVEWLKNIMPGSSCLVTEPEGSQKETSEQGKLATWFSGHKEIFQI